MPPRLYPSTDLHLIVGAVVPMRAFADVAGSWTDLSTVAGFAMMLLPNTAGIITMAARQITAQAVGTQLATLRIAGPNVNVALRATVHHRLRGFVLPTAGFTMDADRTDRVLTVYAQFETAGGVLSTHDVTGLPYLRYTVTTTGAAVVAVDANGRVSTMAIATDGEIALERAALLADDASLVLPEPAGKILTPASTPYRIREEEVPREGRRVTRRARLSRDVDGGSHLWISRQRGIGTGEGWAGLQFDLATRRR